MGGRFFEGYPWRLLFCDIPVPNAAQPSTGGVTTTWANNLVTNRTITLTLNAPTQITGSVWPNFREVNAIFGDGDPLVAQSNRLVYAFRREAPGNVGTEQQPPWVVRAAGILMNPEDQADTDVPLTNFVAFDAWQHLFGRPVYLNNGKFPDPSGTPSFAGLGAETGDQIALQLIKNLVTYDLSGPLGDGFCFIDAGPDYGGTAFYGGTIETTPPFVYSLQQSQMVGDVWNDLVSSGTMDIVLTPIYDPINRPGYTHEVSIFNLAGTEQPNAIFGWSTLNNNLNNIDRMHDGTPQSFINIVNFYAGQGGWPVGIQRNIPSVAKYLPAWDASSYPEQTITNGDAVEILALQALRLAKQGRRTVTLAATPERSPIPLRDYMPGDRVPLYTSDALRVASQGYQRVETIPIVISDDGIEQLTQLLVSPDWRDGPS